MLDMLDDYLAGATTPELRESIRHAHELFDRYGLDTYEQGFEELLMTGDNVDTGVTVEKIYDLTRALQFQILEQHQLVIREDASPSSLNIFLEGLKRIPDYDDPDSLYAILASPRDAMELIAECVALVTGHHATWLHSLVTNCGIALLQTIVKNLDQQHFAIDPNEVILKRRLVDAYQRFIMIADIKQLKIAYLLDNGLDVGHPLTVYLNILADDFEEMDAPYVANEIVAMCLISPDAIDNPRAAVSAHLDKYISNMDKLTKVDVLVGELLLKLAANNEKA